MEMLTQHLDYFRAKPAHLPKNTILLDNGYHPEQLQSALEQVYPQIMSKIQYRTFPETVESGSGQKGVCSGQGSVGD